MGASDGIGWRAFLRLAVLWILTPLLMFGAAGRLKWPAGWAFMALSFGGGIAGRLVLARKAPELVSERARFAEKRDVKTWDRVLMPMVAIVGPLSVCIVAGLDKRFGWSPRIGIAARVVGAGLLSLGYALGTWAMATNRFFDAVVRIQRERGHTVVSSGPYAYVRHPGYAASLLVLPGAALLLGSLWSLIPGALTALAIIVRTALEDRTLGEELEGYRDYAERVRHRLLPGVW